MKSFALILTLSFLFLSCKKKKVEIIIEPEVLNMSAIQLLHYYESPKYKALDYKVKAARIALFNEKSVDERLGAIIQRLIDGGYHAPHFTHYQFEKDGTGILESHDFGKERISWIREGNKIILGCPKKDCSHNSLQHEGEIWSEPTLFSGFFYKYYGFHLNVNGESPYAEMLLLYPNQRRP